MKTFYILKKLQTALMLLFFVSFGAVAQNYTDMYVHGQVTDDNGTAVANHAVRIVHHSSWSTVGNYIKTVHTNSTGYYHDTIQDGWSNSTLATMLLVIHTTDCNGTATTQSFTKNSSSSNVTADFSVCVANTTPDPTTSCKADFEMYSNNNWMNTTGTVGSGGMNYHFVCNSSDGTANGVTCLALGCQCYGLDVHWSFGDGSHSIDKAPSHTYTTTGTFTVSLMIGNSSGCRDTLVKTIVIDTTTNTNPTNCDMTFTVANNSDNLTSNFLADNANTSTHTASSLYHYNWTFGDGSTSTDQHPSHTYTSSGNYNTCLTITSIDGSCTYTKCDSIVVEVDTSIVVTPYCQANYTAAGNRPDGTVDANGVENYLKYHFLYNITSSAAGLQYSWDFGDGNVSTNQHPNHTYKEAGSYNVCLTIVSNDNATNSCYDVICKEITIKHPNHFLGGTVYASNGRVDAGHVYIVKHDTVNGTFTVVDTADINSDGYYFFNKIYKGNYLLKARLIKNSQHFGYFVPTYQGNVPFWNKSNRTRTLGLLDIYDTDIYLKAVTKKSGTAKIAGKVHEGTGKIAAPGDPVDGVEVMLIDMNDEPVAVTVTDANGDYSFDNLPYDTYQIYVDMWGKTTIPAVTTVDGTTSEVSDVNLEVGETEITSGTTGINDKINIVVTEIFPNPSNGTFAIDFQNLKVGKQGMELKIYDVLGREVYQQNLNNTPQTINTNLTKGLYLLQVMSEEGIFNRRIMIN